MWPNLNKKVSNKPGTVQYCMFDEKKPTLGSGQTKDIKFLQKLQRNSRYFQ